MITSNITAAVVYPQLEVMAVAVRPPIIIANKMHHIMRDLREVGFILLRFSIVIVISPAVNLRDVA